MSLSVPCAAHWRQLNPLQAAGCSNSLSWMIRGCWDAGTCYTHQMAQLLRALAECRCALIRATCGCSWPHWHLWSLCTHTCSIQTHMRSRTHACTHTHTHLLALVHTRTYTRTHMLALILTRICNLTCMPTCNMHANNDTCACAHTCIQHYRWGCLRSSAHRSQRAHS